LLAAIGGHEPRTSLIELRPLTPEGRPAIRERAFLPLGDLDWIAAHIRALAPKLNVYVSAAPRVRPDGTAAGVERVWCLWADCDSPESVERLREFRPIPTIVVETSPGRMQAWWALHESIPPAWARTANRGLAAALGADMAAAEPARILRPPGTLNHKHDPPVPVTCTWLDTTVFTAADVVGGLSDPDQRRPATRAPRRPVEGGAALDGLCRTVASAPVGNRNCTLHWAACRAAEHVDQGELDRAAAESALSEAALAAGLGEVEIRATLRSAMNTRAAA
jgi:hypothetical protein